jgi:ATP-dependent Clp protease ATP-binding subunit ClpB
VAAGFGAGNGWETEFASLKQELSQLLRQTLRPEFLNRIDEIIVFRPLSAVDLQAVVTIQLRSVEELLARKGITLRVSAEAREWLATLGYDPTFGARPLRRVIQKHLINALSEKIIGGEFSEGDTVEVVLRGEGNLEFVKRTDAKAV